MRNSVTGKILALATLAAAPMVGALDRAMNWIEAGEEMELPLDLSPHVDPSGYAYAPSMHSPGTRARKEWKKRRQHGIGGRRR